MAKELSAFVDETGDPGWGNSAVPIFAFSAAVVPQEMESKAQLMLAHLRTDFQLGPGVLLQWKKLRNHTRRVHLTTRIVESGTIALIQVCMFKTLLGGMTQDAAILYRYALRLLIERLTWFGRRQNRAVRVRISQIHLVGQGTIDAYMGVIFNSESWIEWNYLAAVTVHPFQHFELLQVADLTAGPIYRAFVPDTTFGTLEPRYLVDLKPIMWRGNDPSPCPRYGFKVMPGPNKARVDGICQAFPNLTLMR